MSLISLCAMLLLLSVGCGTRQTDRERTETLDRFEAIVRWNQFDAMPDFMHPDYLEDNPIRAVDIERLHQFRVSQYRVRQVLSVTDEQGLDRLVELRLYNLHTARERSVEYIESWRWDETRERWMLHSGLPDLTETR
jgi:hypothetical protein